MNINSLEELSNLKTILLNAIIEGVEGSIEDFSKETVRMCPKDTEQLVESYQVKANGNIVHKGKEINNIELPKIENMVLDFSYNTPYASQVHKGLTGKGAPIVNWTTPGTGAGYLETPFALLEDNIEKKILQKVNEL